jgi:hypothetical protein
VCLCVYFFSGVFGRVQRWVLGTDQCFLPTQLWHMKVTVWDRVYRKKGFWRCEYVCEDESWNKDKWTLICISPLCLIHSLQWRGLYECCVKSVHAYMCVCVHAQVFLCEDAHVGGYLGHLTVWWISMHRNLHERVRALYVCSNMPLSVCVRSVASLRHRSLNGPLSRGHTRHGHFH